LAGRRRYWLWGGPNVATALRRPRQDEPETNTPPRWAQLQSSSCTAGHHDRRGPARAGGPGPGRGPTVFSGRARGERCSPSWRGRSPRIAAPPPRRSPPGRPEPCRPFSPWCHQNAAPIHWRSNRARTGHHGAPRNLAAGRSGASPQPRASLGSQPWMPPSRLPGSPAPPALPSFRDAAARAARGACSASAARTAGLIRT
jgi:hypothetical protein